MPEPATPPSLPADAATYAVPGLVRSLALFSVAFCVAGILALLALPFVEPEGDHRLWIVTGLIGFVGCLYLSILILRGSTDTFAVTDEGLWHLSPGKPPLFLAWEDVAVVEAQNVMQRLVVTDRGGTHRLLLEFHLQNFGELRRAVLDHSRRAAGRAAAPQRTPTHSS